MTVRLLKRYDYGDWLRIAAQNNALREYKASQNVWRADDIHALWLQLTS